MDFGSKNGWAEDEFSNVKLSDVRLNNRLIQICDRFSESPESPINQACGDWAETKAAYRFFKNENVDAGQILDAHADKTAIRSKSYKTILAIQDTSYFVYTSHPKTRGLGHITKSKGKNIGEINSTGLVMHSSLALTTEGLPIGLLDQKIIARKALSTEQKKLRDVTPIEEKESFRWLESLKNSKAKMGNTEIVTICDREADIYEFLKLGQDIDAALLVRANVNRAINKKSRYAEKNVTKLWDYMNALPIVGNYSVEVSARTGGSPRKANMALRFGSFICSPPRNNVKHRESKLPDLNLQAVYVLELDPPANEDPLEWMLLTNMQINSFDEACEKVRWYALRWRIEMYHKVLKSGFRVEDCRLSDASRLIKYLTVMSVVAWRVFMITIIARTNPELPCSNLMSDEEWKVLFARMNRGKPIPKDSPKIKDAVRWIAQLGGFLARKNDGEPGTITLWRGWKRLADLVDGWNLASEY